MTLPLQRCCTKDHPDPTRAVPEESPFPEWLLTAPTAGSASSGSPTKSWLVLQCCSFGCAPDPDILQVLALYTMLMQTVRV